MVSRALLGPILLAGFVVLGSADDVFAEAMAPANRDIRSKAASEEATAQTKIALIRQILRVSAATEVNPVLFSVLPLRWQERYWVVFVRDAIDLMAHVAGIGLYANGDAPVPGLERGCGAVGRVETGRRPHH
jgi:hypothetical protein